MAQAGVAQGSSSRGSSLDPPDGPSQPAKKKPRQRVHGSCTNCRKRKVRDITTHTKQLSRGRFRAFENTKLTLVPFVRRLTPCLGIPLHENNNNPNKKATLRPDMAVLVLLVARRAAPLLLGRNRRPAVRLSCCDNPSPMDPSLIPSPCRKSRHVSRNVNETADLKAQVDRLQALVDVLTRLPYVSPPPPPPPSANFRSSEPPTAGPSREAHSSDQVDLRTYDVAESLGFLAVSQFRGDRPSSDPSPSLSPLLYEVSFVATSTVSSLTPHLQQASAAISEPSGPRPQSPSFPFSSQPAPSLHALFGILPTPDVARHTIEHYIRSSDWLLHPFHIPTFQARAASLAESQPEDVDLGFLATFLCTCGVGLALMSDSRAAKCGLPVGEAKQELSRRWLEGVTQALILDNVRRHICFRRQQSSRAVDTVPAKSQLGCCPVSLYAEVCHFSRDIQSGVLH
jgi:hypothetical protein